MCIYRNSAKLQPEGLMLVLVIVKLLTHLNMASIP